MVSLFLSFPSLASKWSFSSENFEFSFQDLYVTVDKVNKLGYPSNIESIITVNDILI